MIKENALVFLVVALFGVLAVTNGERMYYKGKLEGCEDRIKIYENLYGNMIGTINEMPVGKKRK